MKKHDLEPVKDLKIPASYSEMSEQMAHSGGFSAKKFGTSVNILTEMMSGPECYTFLSMPAAPMSTGMRGIILHLVKNKRIDCIITTCGFLDHDVARTYTDYYKGDFMMDDAALGEEGINRLGSVLIPNESYGIVIEKEVMKLLESMHKEGFKAIGTRELCAKLGEHISHSPKKEESVLYWAWRNDIPIFIPAPTDGSVGSQVWAFNQTHKEFTFDIIKDERELSDIVFTQKSMGALMIGGGVSKHHTIWWSQFGGGLDYAVYITTAVEYDGSLSGAQTREAISWGKLKQEAKHVTLEGDATVLLPFMIAAVEERLSE